MNTGVLVKLDSEHEKKLRNLAKSQYGNKKGAIKETVQELIDDKLEKLEWIKKRNKALNELERIRNENRDKLKIGYKFDRDEIYRERTNRL